MCISYKIRLFLQENSDIFVKIKTNIDGRFWFIFFKFIFEKTSHIIWYYLKTVIVSQFSIFYGFVFSLFFKIKK